MLWRFNLEIAMDQFVSVIIEKLGTLGIVFVIWYLTHLAENKRWIRQQSDQKALRQAEKEEREAQRKAESEEREARRVAEVDKTKEDREEHLTKWNDMIRSSNEQFKQLVSTHATERERDYKLFERQAGALEVLAMTSSRISEQINSNQFCPIQRIKENE